MTKRRIARALALACLGLWVCFLAQEVEAQRRGGGGRSISRSGPAAGGSFRTQPSARPSQRPSGAQMPSAGSRPSTQPSPTTRPSQRPGETRPGDAANREDWQQHANDAREDRQRYANNARNDWQDFYEEGGGYYGHSVVIVDYDDHDDDWEAALAGFALGTALSSASFNSMQTGTQCSLSEVTVNEVKYYKCGSTWYNRVIDGTSVNYVIVSAPPGF